MLKLNHTKLSLDKITTSTDLAETMNELDLKAIAHDVISMATVDKESRARWESLTKRIIPLARLDDSPKNFPFEGASNVVHPLITSAILQNAAALSSQVIQRGRVVGMHVAGDDPDDSKHLKARVLADHMNYQLLVESDDWQTSMDRLLSTYLMCGLMFKKTYFDPIKQRNVSDVVPWEDIYIHKDEKTLEDARRVTHRMDMHVNDIIELMRYGVFAELDVDKVIRGNYESGEKDTVEVLEQHRYLDLDGDGYEEPYIVTVLTKTQDVLRLIPRFDKDSIKYRSDNKVLCIKPIHYFTDFHCIPNPDGSYYSLGLGHLLYNHTHALGSLINNVIDAGTLANAPPTFIDASAANRIKGGELITSVGKITKLQSVNGGPIKDAVHQLTYPGPQPVLLNMFDLLLAGAKEIASLNDPNIGQAQVQNVSSSVMQSQVEQGSLIRKAMQGRLFRSLKKEFEHWYRLNSIYLPVQTTFKTADGTRYISDADYRELDFQVRPVADPELATETQRMQQAQQLIEWVSNPALGHVFNAFGVAKTAAEAIHIDNIEQVLPPPDPNAPPPLEVLQFQSDAAKKQSDTQLDAHKLDLQQQDVMTRQYQAETERLKAINDHQNAMAGHQVELEKIRAMDRQNNTNALLTGMKSEVDLQKEHIKAKAKPKPKEE